MTITKETAMNTYLFTAITGDDEGYPLLLSVHVYATSLENAKSQCFELIQASQYKDWMGDSDFDNPFDGFLFNFLDSSIEFKEFLRKHISMEIEDFIKLSSEEKNEIIDKNIKTLFHSFDEMIQMFEGILDLTDGYWNIAIDTYQIYH